MIWLLFDYNHFRLFSYGFCPLLNRLKRNFCQILSLDHICSLGRFSDLRHTSGDSASTACAERNNLFAPQIIGLQKCADDLRLLAPPDRISCICQDWDKKNFIFFCTYSIKSLLIFKVQNSLLLLTFSLLPIEEASSFFTTGFLYYSFCLLHCISDKVLTLKHNLYIFVVVNEHLINYVGKYISVILFQHTILG